VPTYTVHEPHPFAEDVDERATRLVFVKEGFAFWAFIAPVIWLLFNRMWLVLLFFVLATLAVVTAATLAGGNPTMTGWASFALNLIFGFEARNIRRRMLAAKGYDLIGVVTGRDLEDAERRFLTEWLPTASVSAPKPAPRAPSQPFSGGSVPAVGMSLAT
jgi:hypothetical protein